MCIARTQYSVLNSRVCLPDQYFYWIGCMEVIVCMEAVSHLLQRLAQAGEPIKEGQVGGREEWLFQEDLIPFFELSNCESTPSCEIRSPDLEVFVLEYDSGFCGLQGQ
ncbi:hypothetical protein HG531_013864 [Fusarium graminearum]|nr:hypothetical protein HG531_013864 [Fusarium graminearum]